jgi:hypothetical protein
MSSLLSSGGIRQPEGSDGNGTGIVHQVWIRPGAGRGVQ